MFFRKFFVGSALVSASMLATAGVVMATPTPGFEPKPMCQDASTDMTLRKGHYGEGVYAVQKLLGINPADGCFGNQTHKAIEAFQACHGLFIDGIIGPATWRALNAGKTLQGCARNVAPTTSSPTASQGECRYNALTKSEVGRLLGSSDCSAVREFQRVSGLAVDGIVGSATARQLILQAGNPCGLYGNFGNDCFVGLQRNGNLGTLYVVIDGQVVETMPARFGNPDRTNGKKTPEGAFRIFRSIEGDHASENCALINGVRAKCMRNPLYFQGGIAIHGTNDPQSPAGSLGCAGVSNSNSNTTYQYYKDGVTLVVIVDFQRGG